MTDAASGNRAAPPSGVGAEQDLDEHDTDAHAREEHVKDEHRVVHVKGARVGLVTSTRALEGRELYRFFRAGEEETLALRGASLHVDHGEVVAVIGPSGSGKSTLIACLAGLDEPAGGTVWIGGQRITGRREAERSRIRARRVGIMLQNGNLMPHLDVLGNVLLAQRAAGRVPATPAAALVAQVGLDHRAHALPRNLSGGEIARVSLAVALANEPDVLLADEPTGELDEDTEQRVLTLVRERAAAGTGVLLVTHSAQVLRCADRVVTLTDGRTEQ